MTNPNITATDDEGREIENDVEVNGAVPGVGDEGLFVKENGEAVPAEETEAVNMSGKDVKEIGTFDYAVALDRLHDENTDGSVNLDVSEKGTFTLTVDSDLDIILDGASREDVVYSVSIRLDLQANVNISWPSSVTWPDGGAAEPDYSEGIVWVSVATADGGASWEAFVGGEDFA